MKHRINTHMPSRLLSLGVAFGIIVAVLPGIGLASGEPEILMQEFEWAAPQSFTGDIVVAVTFDFGVENDCSVFYNAAGTEPQVGTFGAMMVGESWHRWHSDPEPYQIHSNALGIDSRTPVTEGHSWGVAAGLGGTYTGLLEFTVAAIGTEGWTHGVLGDLAPFSLEAKCDQPFTIERIAGSTQVSGFDPYDSDGNGASVYMVEQTPAGPIWLETAVNVLDGVTDTFGQDEVRVATRGFPGISAGVVTVDGPDGPAAYPISGADMLYLGLPVPVTMDHSGGPGTYDVRFSRAATTPGLCCESFWGIVGGFNEADGFDEIVA